MDIWRKNDRYLFRGKMVDGDGWVHGSISDSLIITDVMDMGGFGSSREVHCNAYEVDSKTIGQCTGMYDFEGDPIYEGDIITLRDDDDLDDSLAVNEYAVVEYVERGFNACTHGGFWSNSDKRIDVLDYREEYIEIVGNIHDNPDLMKEDAENA